MKSSAYKIKMASSCEVCADMLVILITSFSTKQRLSDLRSQRISYRWLESWDILYASTYNNDALHFYKDLNGKDRIHI